ncbi:hypothetical protein Brsp06_02444 [Brucella sp. NBRC 13694]|jgi:hypothetical protein
MKSSEVENAIRYLKLREPFNGKNTSTRFAEFGSHKIAVRLQNHTVKFNRAYKPTYIQVMRSFYWLNER